MPGGAATLPAVTRLCCLAALAALAAVAACGSNLPEVDCSGAPASFGSVTALQQCTACHSSRFEGAERQGAPGSVNYDTPAAAAASASAGADEIASGFMPPDGFAISESQRDQYYKWALCGAAE